MPGNLSREPAAPCKTPDVIQGTIRGQVLQAKSAVGKALCLADLLLGQHLFKQRELCCWPERATRCPEERSSVEMLN